MLNMKSIGLGAAFVSATVAVASLSSAPAQAALLQGSIALSGQSNINKVNQPSPSDSTITFNTVNINQAQGDFLSVTEPITINPLFLTRVGPANPNTPNSTPYTTPGQTPWINFGSQTIGATTANLTFNLDPATFTRQYSAPGSVAFNSGLLTGTFSFDGDTIATGWVNASISGGSSSYQITLGTVPDNPNPPVPEPLTMLGAGTALGLGTLFKRQSSGKQNKDNKNA